MAADYINNVNSILKLYQNKQLTSLIPLLPALQIKGKPYTLNKHFPMEPIFKTVLPPKLVYKCGRQISKSTSIASSSIIKAWAISYLNILTIHPRSTQMRQFSNNIIKPLIDNSKLKKVMVDKNCESAVQQRSFKNQSALYFSFAFLDAERTRGFSCDVNNFDECFTLDSFTRSRGKKVPVTSVSVGDVLDSFTEDGTVVLDTVKCTKLKGVRPVWEIKLISGKTLTCTTNEKLYTTAGWLYLSEILDVIAKNNNCVNPTQLPALYTYEQKATYPDLAIDPIECITEKGKDIVMDIEMDNHHTLFINDFAVHNCQDLDESFIPIIEETMSASDYKISQFSGTPKSLDNLIQGLWDDSSQAEWVTHCEACGYWNMACVGADLLKMIGKDTVVCAKCQKPINPATGHYEHTNPTMYGSFDGYHAPQIILPMHYANKRAWNRVLYKLENYSTTQLYNECFGESYDSGHKLITVTELREAALLTHRNVITEALAIRGRYSDICMGIDWGGGGAGKTSFTSISIVGIRPGTDIIDILFTEILDHRSTDDEQTARVKFLFMKFSCTFIAHDFGGQGRVRETLLYHAKIPGAVIIPFTYVRASVAAIITHKPATDDNPISYYSVDKARSITLLCAYIKKKKILFPEAASCKKTFDCFLALVEEAVSSKYGSDAYFVSRITNRSDDAVHAINFACLALWHKTETFPTLEIENRNSNYLRVNEEEYTEQGLNEDDSGS